MTTAIEEAEEKGMEKGMEKGIEKGMEKGKTTVIIKSHEAGIDIETISIITGKSKEEIKRILKGGPR